MFWWTQLPPKLTHLLLSRSLLPLSLWRSLHFLTQNFQVPMFVPVLGVVTSILLFGTTFI
jgi:hypothetical protein